VGNQFVMSPALQESCETHLRSCRTYHRHTTPAGTGRLSTWKVDRRSEMSIGLDLDWAGSRLWRFFWIWNGASVKKNFWVVKSLTLRHLHICERSDIPATNQGCNRLNGDCGKKQVWRPHVRIWARSQANLLYCGKYLWHCWNFRRLHSDLAPEELCPRFPPRYAPPVTLTLLKFWPITNPNHEEGNVYFASWVKILTLRKLICHFACT